MTAKFFCLEIYALIFNFIGGFISYQENILNIPSVEFFLTAPKK